MTYPKERGKIHETLKKGVHLGLTHTFEFEN